MHRALPLLLSCLLLSGVRADDWPTYRADAARSGYTPERLPNQPRLLWVHRNAPPRPAWPQSDRIEFDLAFQPIIMGDRVIFGSSAEDQVVAINAKTGEVEWRFFTGGPVRFAPAGWKDRLLVTSDDGWLYAVSLTDGHLIWKHRAGPDHRQVLGNERMISKWPARGGPVVMDDVVYFAGGIWPSDGVYLLALKADTGEPVWTNGETGRLFMAQPHGGAEAESGVSAQGYLLVSGNTLLVPTGRAVPAGFDRQTGQLQYYQLQKNQQRGGTRTLVSDRFFCNSGCLFDVGNGDFGSQIGMGPTVAVPGGIVRSEGRSLVVSKWKDVDTFDRKGQAVKVRSLVQDRLVAVDLEVLECIVTAGEAVLGGDGRISAIDYNGQRTQWWNQTVEGKVLGLACGNGHLVATTDQGLVYGFGEADVKAPVFSGLEPAAALSSALDDTAREILTKSGVTAGYAVDLGAGEGELAEALARASDLHIIAVEQDAAKAAAARQRLSAAGLLGTRVAVVQSDPTETGFPKQFANLVISSQSLRGAPGAALLAELERLQRPGGGILCLGATGGMAVAKRAALASSGSWSHQNSNPGNTLCSDDEVIKGPLSMFWFRDVDFEIPNRHGQGPAPLYQDGYLVVGGVHGICCLDAYNGRKLWVHEIRDFLRDFDGIHHDVGIGDTGGPFCLGGGSVYAKHGPTCVRLDLATGKVLGNYHTPAADDAPNRNWGYLSYADGLLYGSVENEEHSVSPRYALTTLRTESVKLFALDPDSGKEQWSFQPEGSIRHNAVAVAGSKVFVIDRPLIQEDAVKDPQYNRRSNPKLSPGDIPSGTLVALDAKTGKKAWSNNRQIWGTQIAVSEKHHTLLMNYKAVRHNFFELPSEIGGRLAAFNTDTGEPLWERDAEYVTRPIINDATIFAQGGAWDLKSGETVPWKFERSYGCGQFSASRNLMLFRSATLGYVDFSGSGGTQNYGGIRPSCWINAIPAGGLVLVPDGSSKCQCSYQMRSWFALQGQ